MLLLAGAVLFALLLAFLNWFLFIRHITQEPAQSTARAASFSREKLDEVLGAFEQRRVQYNSARQMLPSIADPGK